MSSTYRCVSTHPVDLADGRIVAPGDVVQPDLNLEHDRLLVESGLLIENAEEVEPTVAQLRAQAQARGVDAPARATKKDITDALASALQRSRGRKTPVTSPGGRFTRLRP